MVLAGALSKKAGRQTLFTVYFRRNRVRSKVERLSVGTGDRAVIIAGRSVDRESPQGDRGPPAAFPEVYKCVKFTEPHASHACVLHVRCSSFLFFKSRAARGHMASSGSTAVPGRSRHFRTAGTTRLVRSRAWPSRGVRGAGGSSRCAAVWPCGGHTPADAVVLGPPPGEAARLGPPPSRPPRASFGISSTIPGRPKPTRNPR